MRLVVKVDLLDGKIISIHAPLAGCDRCKRDVPDGRPISIHAPLAGCDPGGQVLQICARRISIHAPLAGCDGHRRWFPMPPSYFNPRTPCGVRLASPLYVPVTPNFNPRTPCGVRQDGRSLDHSQRYYFNPRTPCGVRREHLRHAMRIVRDVTPRTPGGVRPAKTLDGDAMPRFQSTHPLRGAT